MEHYIDVTLFVKFIYRIGISILQTVKQYEDMQKLVSHQSGHKSGKVYHKGG